MPWGRRKYRIRLTALVVFSAILFGYISAFAQATPPAEKSGWRGFLNRCAEILKVVNPSPPVSDSMAASNAPTQSRAPIDASFEIRTLDDLLVAYTRGFVPNLADRSQRDAFGVYLKMRFGDPTTHYVNSGTVKRVGDFMKSHHDLDKEPLHPVRVETLNKSYPVTPELDALVKKQREAAAKVLSNLFQIEANLGFWKKILQYEDSIEISKDLPKDERKRLQEESKQMFLAALNIHISPELRKELAEGKLSPAEKAKKLYEVLGRIRDDLLTQGKNLGPVSQAMIDLLHTVGFQDKALAKALKDGDGLERLTAMRRILTERDNLAHELGFEGHFVEALTLLGIRMPTGVEGMESFEARLSEIEREVLDSAVITQGSGETRWIRPLSLIEAPFRSCVGLDCSSQTWLTTALNPNFQFYTWTDADGNSMGQITLTLGEANLNGGKQNVAFANKIQNISPADLPVFLEGVRRALEADGYLLGIPEDLGERVPGSGGISNSTAIFDAIRRIPKDSAVLTGFKPHRHDKNYGYDKHDYDRSNHGLPMRAVSPLTQAEGLEFTLEPKVKPWRVSESIDLQKLVSASYELKNGNLDEKMRYIPSMQAIQKAGLQTDPEFYTTLKRWLKDPREDFKLRKQVFLHYLVAGDADLAPLLAAFSPKDRATILQNVLDTPRYRAKLLERRGHLPDLAVRVRDSKKVRDMLLAEFDRKGIEAYQKILEAKDISETRAPALLRAARTGLKSTDIDKRVSLLELVQGTSVEGWFLAEVQVHFISNLSAPTLLSRALSTAISSPSKTARDFAHLLIHSEDTRIAATPIVRIYREILKRGDNFERASSDWMRDLSVEPELKAEFLLSQSSPWSESFLRLDREIPQTQRAAVEKVLDRRSTIRVYDALAKERGISPEQIAQAKMEAFLRVDLGISREGTKFTMGSSTTEEGRWNNENRVEVILTKPIHADSTHVTQLQYYLLTQEVPSKFHGDGVDATVSVRVKDGMMKEIDLNRPVETVNFHESVKAAQALAEAVQKTGGKAKPRLPTEAEWEYMARAKTESAYFFGNEASELENYAWFHGNSEGRTHPIASKPTNQFGVFDPIGNVWVWTQNWYADAASSGIDPTGPSTGSIRVSRGGSWGSSARFLRSANRYYDRPEDRFGGVGFRLVWDMPE